ncbi:MAG: bifunctional oligoribonuclease/PAP phosphatase NrnA [Firmicutes bacterium]|jgi:phosphoesterase RecJ-like protein|nr:bifunctional oligoribonuclease/PAP phosphatase NrnA [Bacillota bacterium]HPU00701.1 bifunctional oligoribonuclease/PAP phosphatase NrnA [Bacillota bacterium]
MTDQEKVIALFRELGSFNLVSHMQPDGDSIGSLLALGEALAMLGKGVRLFTPAPVPRKYAFLPGSENISAGSDGWEEEAAAVVVDCSDLERTGHFKEQIRRAAVVINIDHHVTNRRFGTANLVDPEAAATGEIVFRLLESLQLKPTASIAECLYVAISTDTGSFKFENTTAAAHRAAAALLESQPLNPGIISQRLFDEHPLSYLLLLKKVLGTLELYGGKRVAVITASRDMLEQCGAQPDELDGIINYARNIEGVEIGIMFYIDGSGEIKIGFRSKNIDVSALAGRMGGGGHPRAAGCRLKGAYGPVKERVIGAALLELEGAPSAGRVQ